MAVRRDNGWFSVDANGNGDADYYHFHAVEDEASWEEVRGSILSYFLEAHADAVERLQKVTGISLHPASLPVCSPYEGYPHLLPQVTLQGYFGEIISAWFAENDSPSGISSWEVPGHLFRYHLQAFQYLELLSQTGTAPSAIVGRPGDDCLAFQRNETGSISAVLYCEAKCTATHDSGLIKDAHEKASMGAIADLPQLIEVIAARKTQESIRWVDALQELHLRIHDEANEDYSRHDLVCYVHSQVPLRKPSWIASNECHTSYEANRILNVFEVRLGDVLGRLREIYAPEVWSE